MASASTDIPRRIAAALRGAEPPRLDLLALLLCEIEYPELDASACLRRLDELAVQARPTPAEAALPAPYGDIAAINRCLFDENGFHGNIEDYYDSRNSFLNEVLERRTGIPITLSILYIEVARRRGLRLAGVGMPGHFLVRTEEPPGVLVDPFHRGRILTERDCEARLKEIYGEKVQMDPAFLARVDPRYIVTRMLQNLRTIYTNTNAVRKLLPVLDILLELYPGSAEEYKQRGALYQNLMNYSRAIADFEQYLALARAPSDADEIRQNITGLKRLRALMN